MATKKSWKENIKGVGKVRRIKKGLSFKETSKIWNSAVKKGEVVCLTDALINYENELVNAKRNTKRRKRK